MHTVLCNETPPPDRVAHQILEIVADNQTDLSMLGLPPSNPLYGVYRWALSYEISLYITRIGKIPTAPVELIVAYDDGNDTDVVGFLMYLPVPSHPDACGVTYMAVKQSHRRRGIGSAMMRECIARFSHVELTCFVKKVPFYENLGFQVLDALNTQVVMNTRSASTTGLMAIVDTAPILQLPQVKQIHAQLVQRWGIREMAKAEKQRDRHIDQLRRQAAAYVRERLDTQGNAS
jgi:GNAT superfamily N-acetyltransferase